VKLPDPPLLVITDRKQARLPLAEVLTQAFAAGCRWASLREKDLSAANQIALAHKLRPIARRFGAILTLHGEAAVARNAALDGVHLPAGGDVAAARALLGPRALIGLSVHSTADLGPLAKDAPDYVIAGPAYATASKPSYGPALGGRGLAAIVARSRVPVLAVGGIATDNLGDVMRAGARGVAVMGGVMRADDAADEVRALWSAFKVAAARPAKR
jgi:thiamine-phosphate pyrophosphorylase